MAATNASVTDPPYKEVWASLFYNNGHIEKEKIRGTYQTHAYVMYYY
jgi:hypothetical protein